MSPRTTLPRRIVDGDLVEAWIDPTEVAAAARTWTAVRDLWLARAYESDPIAGLARPGFPALRFVGSLMPRHAASLAALARPLVGVGFEFPAFREAVGDHERAFVAAIARPEVRELAFEGASPAHLAWLWDTRIGRQATRVRTSCGLAGTPAWVAAADVPANVGAIEVSSDFGWFGWVIELTRGADGRFSRVVATLKKSRKDGAAPEEGGVAPVDVPAKAIDLVEHVFDELAPVALEHFALQLDRTKATRRAVAAIAAALAHQTRLASASLPFDTPVAAATPTAARPKSVKQQRAEAKAARDAAARAAFAAAVAALPAPIAELAPVDFDDVARCERVGRRLVDLANGQPPIAQAYVDVAWAALALPFEETRRFEFGKIAAGCVRLLSAAPRAGNCARAIALIESTGERWIQMDLRCVPTEELPALFDWYEVLNGPDLNTTCSWQAVRDVAILRGDASTRADLERRLPGARTMFVKWAYEQALAGGRFP